MKKIIISIFSLCFAVIIYIIPSLHASEDMVNICKKRCSTLQGTPKHNCLIKCIRFSKSHTNFSKYNIKKQRQQCEKICKNFKGIKNVQCVRICLERIKVIDRKDLGNIKNYSESCQNRCRNMPAKYKYNCLMRCKKNNEVRQSGGGAGSLNTW